MNKHFSFKEIILSEDENVIFINKPANSSSLDDRNSHIPGINKLAKKYNEHLQLCHRLDKETSGIMVLAKNPETYRDIAMLFESRNVKKKYHTVVDGQVNFNHKSISLPISVTKKNSAKIDLNAGKKSETIFNTIKQFKNFSLIECMPVTGRLHQIRVHLASQNFPVVADELYGGKIPKLSHLKRKFKSTETSDKNGMINRVALHAFSIEFNLAEKKYSAEAPYPKDFQVFLKILEKYDS